MICGICKSESENFGQALLLEKYQVQYFRCPRCGFIQTEKPYWLAEAYTEALAAADVGVMQRNLQTSTVTAAAISLLFPAAKKFLDYGGGHGTFVRLMRDRGFNFLWQDLYAKNIHARTFEHVADTRYDLVTAFELLEHLPDPFEGIAQAFALSDNVLTTTLLIPDPPPIPPNWWYYAVRSGQHVSFYTPAALAKLARHFDRHVLSSGWFHLFTRKPVSAIRLRMATGSRTGALVNRVRRRQSLVPSDYERVSGFPLE
ncbi:MAG: class I SAM-dependent methyltransferase [Acidobacteriaceae bacterium]